MSSGSKKRKKRADRSKPRPATPASPELTGWQIDALREIGRSPLAREAVFGGGAAMAAVYLHHRFSEDLDFFFRREIAPEELGGVVRSLGAAGTTVNLRSVGALRTLVLSHGDQAFGRIDFAFYPYDPVDRGVKWQGLSVDSLRDMTVNKVQAVLTRFKARDFIDLYFLLREGPETELVRLLDFARAKFDVGADRYTLGERLMLVRDIDELPRMIRPVAKTDLVAFFEECARELARKR